MRKLTPTELEDAKLFERGVECGRKEAAAEIERLRAALMAAQNWFMHANAPDDAGTDYLNDGGWDAAEDVAEIIDAALPLPPPPEGEK